MTLAQLLNNISSKELSEWIAFSNIEPFGEFRADIRAAMIACVMANSWRGSNQPAFKISDFMITFNNKKEQTVDEIKSILKQYTITSGGKVIE